MKKNLSRLLVSLFSIFLFVLSCQREDLGNKESKKTRTAEDFFKRSSQTNTFAKSGVDYVSILEDYNRETNFISRMSDQKGNPIWDKMKVFDATDATGLLIPLSEDSETLSSILSVRIDGENNVEGWTNITNDRLKSVIYDDKVDKTFRENILYTFMYVDNQTFGNEFFTNIPTDLFLGLKYGEDKQRIWIKDFGISTTATNSPSSKILFIENCSTGWSCKNHESWSNCDKCPACFSTTCTTVMVYIPDEQFPSGGGGGGGSDGGGGGYGTASEPPKDPCSLSVVGKAFYRLNPGCGGGTGIGEPILQNPCEKIKATVNKPAIKDTIAKYKTFAENSLKKERGVQEFFSSPNLQNGTVGNDYKVSFITTVDTKGTIHVHPIASVHMFSAQDILFFIHNILRFKNGNNIKECYIGIVSSSGNYFITFNGTNLDLPPPVTNQQEFNDYLEKMNKDYKEMKNELLKQEGKDKAGILSDTGLQKLFFKTIQKIGLEGKFDLIKEENGKTFPILQDANGEPQKQPEC